MKLNIFYMDLPLKEEESHEIVHYKKYCFLKDILRNKKPNIVIHGCSNSGKTYLIEYIFQKIFGRYRTRIEDNVEFKENINYYIFNFSNHLKHNIIKKINHIISNFDHFNNNIKYIIIDNYNNISDSVQKNIKVFIEKFIENSRFILITNKLFSIEPSCRSNCFTIRINEPNKYDKFIYFKFLLEKYNIQFNHFLLLKNCEKYSINHIRRLYYDDLIYSNIYDTLYITINKIMNSPFNINEIKKLSMKIKELNLNIDLIFTLFVKNNPYTYSKNNLLIKEIAHYNYIIKKAYRDIISIEALLIKIYHILNYEG